MILRTFMVVALSAVAVGALDKAVACPANRTMAAVVQQVTGARTDVFVERPGEGRFRPAPLDVLCAGDVVVATSEGAGVMYRLDGVQTSTRVRGPARVELAVDQRRGGFADNALQILLDTWMPEMRRTSNFGVVRGRADGPARWTLAGLSDGAAVVAAGVHPLLLPWEGSATRYRVQVVGEDGATVADLATTTTEARVPARGWTPGAYAVRVFQSDAPTPVLEGKFQVSPVPTAPASTVDFGAEIAAAAEGLRLAHIDARRFSLHAAQLVDSAPAQGLDRAALYRALGALNDDEGV